MRVFHVFCVFSFATICFSSFPFPLWHSHQPKQHYLLANGRYSRTLCVGNKTEIYHLYHLHHANMVLVYHLAQRAAPPPPPSP